MAEQTTERSVWVRTQPSSTGRTYVVTIDFSDDLSTTLKPSEASTYAGVVLDATMRAAHDAAIYNQLKGRGLPLTEIASAVNDLRNDRAPLRATGTPLALVPGVNREGAPFLIVNINGQPTGQWTVDDARNHAVHVLEAVHAADLDAAYRRFLIGVIGLEEEVALAAVGDLLGSVR